MILDLLGGRRTTVVMVGLLRVNHADPGQGFGVPQIPLVPKVPIVELFHDGQPTLVVQSAGEFGEPGAQIVGDSVDGPEADFFGILDRVLPAIRLFYSDAEDSHYGLVAHGGPEFFAVLPVFPGWRKTASRLPVGKEGGREYADALHVELAGGATACVRDVARFRIDLTDLGIP